MFKKKEKEIRFSFDTQVKQPNLIFWIPRTNVKHLSNLNIWRKYYVMMTSYFPKPTF